MKIGILTHALKTNYGGLLQNFALQRVLKNMGYEPITMDYFDSTPFHVKIISYFLRMIRRLKGEKIPLRGWMTDSEYLTISKNTQSFINSYISRTNRVHINDLSALSRCGFDAIIVGSDQVWRGCGRKVEKFFLSDFQSIDIPKIAYAASFGVGEWTYSEKQTEICKSLIQKFTAVSVREKDGVFLCEKYLKVPAEFVLDPTLLLDREAYRKLVENKNGIVGEHSNRLMTYILDKSDEKRRIVSFIEDSKGLKSHEVIAEKIYGHEIIQNIEQCVFPSVEDWLEGFITADYVVTDSFHGTVFAIIFNKPFVSISNSVRGKSRFESLLNYFGLENRLISEISEVEKVLNTDIDWERVNTILKQGRANSIKFLENSLK